MHRVGVASLRVILCGVGRGEHLSAVSARRRAEVVAARPRVGAVDVPAVLGQVPHRLAVAVRAVRQVLQNIINVAQHNSCLAWLIMTYYLTVELLDVDPEVLLARKQLLALSALQETVSSFLRFCTDSLPIGVVTAILVISERSRTLERSQTLSTLKDIFLHFVVGIVGVLFPRVLPRVGLGDVLVADGTADEDVIRVHVRSEKRIVQWRKIYIKQMQDTGSGFFLCSG